MIRKATLVIAAVIVGLFVAACIASLFCGCALVDYMGNGQTGPGA